MANGDKVVGRNAWDALSELFITLRDWRIIVIIFCALGVFTYTITGQELTDSIVKIIQAIKS